MFQRFDGSDKTDNMELVKSAPSVGPVSDSDIEKVEVKLEEIEEWQENGYEKVQVKLEQVDSLNENEEQYY